MNNWNPDRIPDGFKLVSATPIESMGAEARRFEHAKSGARIIHIATADTENCFCICLPTPPPDDTGMPHILEHMTLAGSEKYPLKEPFFEMIKHSMATFINALTGNDMTYYPVSSNIHKDLFNLADVYFDAVFHPLLSRDIFLREAHHLAPADPADPTGSLRMDGIVYSEMKGVFSDPESILERDGCRRLLPDTCHGFESGGDPEAIPDLTLDELRAFHATNYHPSNAFIILYGDIPSEDYLSFLAPRLEPFDRIEPLPPARRQTPWREPRTLRDVYPIPAGSDPSEKTYLMLSWLLGDAADPEQSALLNILSLLLVGNDGAPLKKAVNDSHLGSNVFFDGMDACGLEATFHIAIDGSEPDRLDAFRSLVLDTLRDIASRPFAEEQIKAAFQQSVYPCVEIVNGYPLNVAFRIASAWNAGRDPAEYLDFMRYYDAVRSRLEADPQLLGRVIREKFIDNPHRLDIALAPDAGCGAKADAALAERLAKIRASLSDDEVRAIAADAERLSQLNATPNPPELVAALPCLATTDIPERPRKFPIETTELDGGRAIIETHGLPTNGIVYLTASFDLTGLPEDLWPFVPRYTGAISDFGVEGSDWAETARRRAAVCGSLSASFSGGSTVRGVDDYVPTINVSLKTTLSSLNEALDAFEDALFRLDPCDRERMDELLVQERTAMRAEVVQDARATTRYHALRSLSLSGHRANQIYGLPQLALIERLAGDTDAAYPAVTDAILRIRGFILDRSRADFAVAAPPEAMAAIRGRIDKWRSMMADGSSAAGATSTQLFTPSLEPRLEGLSASLQVAFSAFAMPAPHFTDVRSMPLRVAASLVSSDYILPELRFKGNAYGAGLSYDGSGARLVFSSFRDPHVAETYEVYGKALDYVKSVKWTKEQIDNAIMTVAKSEAVPFRPASTIATSLSLRLARMTEDFTLRQWRNLLATTPETARDAIVEALEAGLPHGSFAVAASAEMLDAAKARLPGMTVSPLC